MPGGHMYSLGNKIWSFGFPELYYIDASKWRPTLDYQDDPQMRLSWLTSTPQTQFTKILLFVSPLGTLFYLITFTCTILKLLCYPPVAWKISSHRQQLQIKHLFSVKHALKTKRKEKMPGFDLLKMSSKGVFMLIHVVLCFKNINTTIVPNQGW